MEFEEREFYVPENTEDYLKRIFGENYMFLMYPPEVGIAEWVYSNFGLGIYIVIHFITCFVGSYVAYIPGIIAKKVNNRKFEKKIEKNIDNKDERIEG